MRLCDPANAHLHPWAVRHPWQSWKNRYKTFWPEFDQDIDAYLDRHPSAIERWDPHEAISKKAANKLGYIYSRAYRRSQPEHVTSVEENYETEEEESGSERSGVLDDGDGEEESAFGRPVDEDELEDAAPTMRGTFAETDEPALEDELTAGREDLDEQDGLDMQLGHAKQRDAASAGPRSPSLSPRTRSQSTPKSSPRQLRSGAARATGRTHAVKRKRVRATIKRIASPPVNGEELNDFANIREGVAPTPTWVKEGVKARDRARAQGTYALPGSAPSGTFLKVSS
jgi:hypothetical protein